MSVSYAIRGSSEEILPAVAVAGFVGVPLAVEVAPGPAEVTGPEGVISGASSAARFMARCSGTTSVGRGSFAAAEVSRGVVSPSSPAQAIPPPAPATKLQARASVLMVASQVDSWISFGFEELRGAEVSEFMLKARPMLAALINNGIRHSGFQTAVRPFEARRPPVVLQPARPTLCVALSDGSAEARRAPRHRAFPPRARRAQRAHRGKHVPLRRVLLRG